MSRRACFAPLRRPWAVWLALLIAVFGAVAPTLSHALVWSGSSAPPLVEICTTSGPRWVALAVDSDLPDSPDGQESGPHIEHCPFCLHATDRVAPPPCVSFPDFRLPSEPVVPTSGQAFLLVTHYAPAPPPRGPPRPLVAI